MEYTPTCFRCAHFQALDVVSRTGLCPAFPKGIPQKVFFGAEPHDKPLPGQEGNFVFEPKEE